MSPKSKTEKKNKAAKAAKPTATKPAVKRTTKPKHRPATGPWQEILTKAAEQFNKAGDIGNRAAKAKKTAGLLLWDGAQAAINGWDKDADPSAEALSNEIKDVLGESRKGDVSKIKTVALAVAHKGLNMEDYLNLSRAYAAAKALSGEVSQKHAEEDAAAEAAIAKIEAPAKTGTPEGAALIVLAKGPDEAARLLLDALGADNTPAHRALVRALTSETAGRIKVEPKAPAKKTATPKEGAEIADDTTVDAPKAAPVATKAKPAPVKEKAAPAVAAEAAAAEEALFVEPAAAPVAVKEKGAPVKANGAVAVATKAKPVARRAARPAVRRG